jgi:probable rRNA maturation factor
MMPAPQRKRAPMAEAEIDVVIEDESWAGLHPALEEAARAAAAAALAAAEAEGPVDGRPAGLPLAVTIVFDGDARVRLLNNEYRGKDKPTNVLSFPMLETEGGRFLLGDIVLARETVQREAEEQGKSFADHLIHLIVHGTLHLIGYDHMDNAEAEEMESLEIRILADMGIENPYSDPDYMA